LSWICSKCEWQNQDDKRKRCVNCNFPNIYNREICKDMTPNEELFAEFFNKHRNSEPIINYVKDMNLFELRTFRERMSIIALEAKASIYACDDAEREIKKKKAGPDKPSGFEKSLNQDETATNAINAIKERQKRLSKKEKLQAGLIKLFTEAGMTTAEATVEAERRTSNIAIKEAIDNADIKEQEKPKEDNNNNNDKPFHNPFEGLTRG